MRKRAGKVRRRRYFSPDDRRRFVEAWRRSGLSQLEFGKRNGIHGTLLTRWKREFPETAKGPAPALVPVRLVEGPSRDDPVNAGGFDLRLPSGVALAIPAQFDRESLAALLDVLGRAGC